MKLNYINLFLGLIWLAVLILSFIPAHWSNVTIKCIAALFAFLYIKDWFDGLKD